jgi:hypothetical protein
MDFFDSCTAVTPGPTSPVPEHVTVEAPPVRPPRLTLLPARNIYAHALGMSEDPFFLRPVDLVRRAFDELALALHYYIAGLLFSTDEKYYFLSRNQMVRARGLQLELLNCGLTAGCRRGVHSGPGTQLEAACHCCQSGPRAAAWPKLLISAKWQMDLRVPVCC